MLKIQTIKTCNGYMVRITKGITIAQGEGKTLKGARDLAFALLEQSKCSCLACNNPLNIPF